MLKQEDIDNVRSSVTMKQVAGAYGYRINRAGFISCPFHGQDKNPSMKIYDGNRGYYCFTCHAGGDAIDFVRNHDGLEFEPAVRKLAEMFGIPISDGASGISEADRKRMDEQRAKREMAEKERKAAKESLNQLSANIHSLESFQSNFSPLTDAWCACQRLIDQKQVLWDELFKKIYDERR